MKAKVHFYIRTDRPIKDSSVQIYILLLINKKKRLKISTGKYVSLKKEYQNLAIDKFNALKPIKREDLYYWDCSKERAIKGTDNWEKINEYLDDKKAQSNKVLLNFELMNVPISINAFKNAFIKPEGLKLFKEYFLKELKDRKHLIAPDTYRGHQATITKIDKYKPNLTLAEIDYKFLSGFENYMLKPIKEGGLGNIPSTAAKTMTVLRAFINIAIKNKDFLKEAYPFIDYKIKHVDITLTSTDYLEPDDIRKIENLLSPENISNLNTYRIKAIERFLFACYTGLRFKDVSNLNWKDHIFSKWVLNPKTNTTTLRSYINITMNKTARPVFVPLIEQALEIMGERKEGNVFEKISNSKMNKHLKVINNLAGLNKKLSFHVSRHSFATICFLYGIPEKVGQELLGHKNRKFTEIYTHLSKNRLFYEMDKVSTGLTDYALVIDEADSTKKSIKEMLPVIQGLSQDKLDQLKGIINLLGK